MNQPENIRYLRPPSSGYDYDAHMAGLSDRDIRKKRWLAGMPEAKNRRLSNMSLSNNKRKKG